jgi:hypothetical protein
MNSSVPDEGELGIPWERWADGLPHRLKRKRDFGDVDPAIVRVAAKYAAKRMGKAVQVLPDKMLPNSSSKYLWVQFADHEIRIGEPCKCGGQHLLRVHPFFARCSRCNAQLLLAPKKKTDETTGIDSLDEEEDEGDEGDEEYEEGRPQPEGLLRQLSDVHLARLEQAGDREIYRGYGRLGTTPVLLIAQFRAAPHELLDAEQAFDRVAAVQVLPLRHLNGLLDTSALMGPATDWDLVL